MTGFAEKHQNLSKPFNPELISWRIGSTTSDKQRGLALAYIDGRDVMQRLDEVVGPENWQARYSHADKITICEIGIRIDGEWVWKANGAGSTDVEAEKGACTDAFKRAAVLWGIGQYLYSLKSPWVDVELVNDRCVIRESEKAKLMAVLAGEAVASNPPVNEPAVAPVASATSSPPRVAPEQPKKFDTSAIRKRLLELKQKPDAESLAKAHRHLSGKITEGMDKQQQLDFDDELQLLWGMFDDALRELPEAIERFKDLNQRLIDAGDHKAKRNNIFDEAKDLNALGQLSSFHLEQIGNFINSEVF
jgi:hypothetical protein